VATQLVTNSPASAPRIERVAVALSEDLTRCVAGENTGALSSICRETRRLRAVSKRLVSGACRD